MMWDGQSLKKSQWSPHESRAWYYSTGPAAILDDDGPASSWRATTIELTLDNYLHFLGWLAFSGQYVPGQSASDRITSQNVAAYVGAMRQRKNAAATIYMRVLSLDRALASLEPKSDRKFLRSMLKKLPKKSDVASKRARLQETAVLVDTGVRLMKGIDGLGGPITRSQATLYRDGLQIALLALRPLRRTNFAEIEIGKHLLRRGTRIWLFRDGDETKNGVPIDVHVPSELVGWLDRYLKWYRPLLSGKRYFGSRLWVSYQFTPQAADSIYDRVLKRTEEAFGLGLNLHLFRDCLATSLAINEPKLVGISHALLGNAPETCRRFYNLAQSHEAGAKLQETVVSLRERYRNRSKSGDI